MKSKNEENSIYWNYITDTIIESINELNDYNDKDFIMIKFKLLYNLGLMLSSEQEFDECMETLKQYKNNKVLKHEKNRSL